MRVGIKSEGLCTARYPPKRFCHAGGTKEFGGPGGRGQVMPSGCCACALLCSLNQHVNEGACAGHGWRFAFASQLALTSQRWCKYSHCNFQICQQGRANVKEAMPYQYSQDSRCQGRWSLRTDRSSGTPPTQEGTLIHSDSNGGSPSLPAGHLSLSEGSQCDRFTCTGSHSPVLTERTYMAKEADSGPVAVESTGLTDIAWIRKASEQPANVTVVSSEAIHYENTAESSHMNFKSIIFL